MRFIRPLIATLAVVVLVSSPAMARTWRVQAGGSIRAALALAAPGDRIEVMPGIYQEGAAGDLNALTVTLDGIQLVGLSTPSNPVVLQNTGGQGYGVWVSPLDSTGAGPEANDEVPPCGLSGALIKGFVISGFTVRGFQQHGVHLACVDGFQISNNAARDNGVYGLFPILSSNGVMTGNVVTGTAFDAGIYVGQSESVAIAGNRSEDNLIGIEVENSRNCAVVGNEISNNTIGVLVDVLPFLLKSAQETTLVARNSIHDNNRINTASPDDITSALPAGTGILVLGGHATDVQLNVVQRNGFTGIAVASLCLGLELLGEPCAGLNVDPDPSGTHITLNLVEHNGTVPQPYPLFDALRADLVWDGSGSGNCWSKNRFETSSPASLPACR